MPAPDEGHDEGERVETARTYNCAALRTLHALERTLRNHIADLHNIDCEDVEAAEAIVFAIEAAEKALANAHAVKRGQRRD